MPKHHLDKKIKAGAGQLGTQGQAVLHSQPCSNLLHGLMWAN